MAKRVHEYVVVEKNIKRKQRNFNMIIIIQKEDILLLFGVL
jgi:hypothetical protein